MGTSGASGSLAVQQNARVVITTELGRDFPGTSPDRILGHYDRRLIAKKWDHSAKRRDPGRPPVMKEIADLTVRVAREAPSWGYTRIQGALANLGHRVARTTVATVATVLERLAPAFP